MAGRKGEDVAVYKTGLVVPSVQGVRVIGPPHLDGCVLDETEPVATAGRHQGALENAVQR